MTPAPNALRIAIIAGPTLSLTLSEHFSTRPNWDCYVASSLENMSAPTERSVDVLIVDADACRLDNPETLALLRARAGPLILIGNGDPPPLANVFAHLPRPFRLADLIDCIQTALARPPFLPGLPTPADLRLTEKESMIFARLAAAGGGEVARTRLLSEIWGYGPGVSTRTLETHIGRLRRKLAAAGSGWRVLTAAGGYRLVDRVGHVDEKSGDGARNPIG